MAAIPRPLPVRARRVRLPRRHCEQRVVPQHVVVVEVLVATGLSQHPLREEFLDRVLDQLRIPVIAEALREPSQQPGPLRHLTQQQQAARIRAEPSRTELGYDRAPPEPLESELLFRTVCPHRAAPPR